MGLLGKKKKESAEQRIERRLEDFKAMYSPKTDPQGMYTGVPENPYEEPVQDADDL